MPLAKITRPPLRGVLPRPRLFQRLDGCRPVAWVRAPPGAGKTTLVASYLEARRLPALWYHCDGGDDDLAPFFDYLARAAGTRGLPRFTADRAAAPADFAREFFRALWDRRRAAVLVLDGYDDVPGDSPVHAAVREAMGQLPRGGRVVVTSRAEPPAAFARLRANRAIGEIDWAELRLRAPETRALLKRLAPSTPATLAATLHERTGGWAAGLVLMLQERRGLAVERRRTPDGIVDYFANEIMAKASAETQAILLETAFLARFSGAVAESLTGRPHAGSILARLHREGCFLLQHAEPNAVYEYQPLFRAFLLRRAYAVLATTRRAEIQRKAAGLLEREGRVAEAVELLRQASDWAELARLVEAATRTAEDSADGRRVDEWIAALPADTVAERPWLLFRRGIGRLADQPAAARDDFAAALPLFRKAGDAAGAFLAWALGVETIPYEETEFRPLEDWLAAFDDLMGEFPEFPSAEVEMRVAGAMLLVLLCRRPQHREIKVWARRAVELVQAAPSPADRLAVTCDILTYQLWIGDLESAATLAGDLRALSRAPQVPAHARIAAARVLARYEWLVGDVVAAQATVDAGLALVRASGVELLRHSLMLEAAAASLSAGDRVTAGRWLAETRRDLARLTPFARVWYHFLAGWDALLAADVTTALGEHETLLSATWQCGMPALRCLAHLFAAQALDRAGTPGADVHLAQATDLALQIDSELLQFMALLVEADVARRRGDEGRVTQTLARAMPMGRRHGYVNAWLWSAAAMAELAARALDADIEPDYVRRLVRERKLAPAEAPVEVETWPWPVKVFTLGRFEVLTGERPVQFAGKAQKKPLALLQALIALGGQRVREDRLTEALWPDADGDAAHQALSTTLHRLRRLLRDERAIVRLDGHISLVSDHCWVDLWAVERTIARAEAAIARSPVRDHEWAASVRWTDRAVALYRGEFLSGNPSLPWAAGVADRLRERVLRQLRKLGHLWESIGDWEEAAGCYERAVAINECAEEFYRRLMLAYERLGRRADAILVYQRCRQALAALTATPAPETEAIAKSLQVSRT